MTPLISIIIPVLNEEENINALYARLSGMAGNSTYKFEFIFIDDGSTDSTFPLLKELAPKDNRIKTVKLSRNFGSHAACLAGLVSARGSACMFLSADMQEPPELIAGLLEQWKNGYEVVLGIRETATSLFSKVYYMLVRRFALKTMPPGGTDVFLIDRKVVNVIANMKEMNTSIFGLILWSGFRQALVPYERKERQKGSSKWTLGKKIKLFIDTFVAFSYFPVRLMSFLGLVVALAGFVYAAIVIFNRLFFSTLIEGWTSLMVVVLVVSGIQMMMLGVLGEYLWRNFDETRQRPPFIISERVGFEE